MSVCTCYCTHLCVVCFFPGGFRCFQRIFLFCNDEKIEYEDVNSAEEMEANRQQQTELSCWQSKISIVRCKSLDLEGMDCLWDVVTNADDQTSWMAKRLFCGLFSHLEAFKQDTEVHSCIMRRVCAHISKAHAEITADGIDVASAAYRRPWHRVLKVLELLTMMLEATPKPRTVLRHNQLLHHNRGISAATSMGASSEMATPGRSRWHQIIDIVVTVPEAGANSVLFGCLSGFICNLVAPQPAPLPGPLQPGLRFEYTVSAEETSLHELHDMLCRSITEVLFHICNVTDLIGAHVLNMLQLDCGRGMPQFGWEFTNYRSDPESAHPLGVPRPESLGNTDTSCYSSLLKLGIQDGDTLAARPSLV